MSESTVVVTAPGSGPAQCHTRARITVSCARHRHRLSTREVRFSDVNRKPKFWLSDKKPKPTWFLVFQLKFSWYFVVSKF